MSSDSDNSIILGESVTFTATGGNAYEFFVNNASVKNGSENTYTATTLINNAKVKVKVSNTVTSCSKESDEIMMTVQEINTAAEAGPNQLNICGIMAQLAAVEPSVGTGQWTATPAGGSFTNATKANTQFQGAFGKTYTLTWTVTGASDQVLISFNADADNDTVQDCKDLCNGGDDRINTDGMGMPDDCDCDLTNTVDEFMEMNGLIFID